MALVALYQWEFAIAENLLPQNIDATIKRPLFARKKQLAEEYIRARFAISHDEFLKSGKERLPADQFNNASHHIDALDLKAELIITGFVGPAPEIYYTDGRCRARATEDYAVIGEGCYLAEASLLRREQVQARSLEATLYNVWEAKKYSEAVASVGKSTTLVVLSADGKMRFVNDAAADHLEKLYKQYGPRETPDDLKFPDRMLDEAT